VGRIDIKKLMQNKRLFWTAVAFPFPFLLGLVAFLVGASSTTSIALVSIGAILVILPSVLISFFEYREIKDAEDKFPHFLSDLSQSASSGMTLPQAIEVASQGDYGKLTKYVKQLNIWLSWNQTFPKAWGRFTNRLKRSVLIRRINAIILEAFHSGGDIKKTLGSLSANVTLIKDMESERKSIMQQQIIIMYVIFFVFIAVIVALYKILSPILYIQQIGAFSGISVQSSGAPLTIEYFRNLFFLMTLVEAICAGMIAGYISEERLVAGVKHVLVMVSASVFLFFVFIFPSALSVEISVFPNQVSLDSDIQISGSAFIEGGPASGATVTLIEPNGNTINLYTDNVGEFRYGWEPPQEPGDYQIRITVEYEREVYHYSSLVTVLEP
jgi:flagellar protein FlaJ|tara:strand:+ start:4485 stop:5636 length:1152 start_codon:yes stop_codon:yes gene_type:complete